jgi:hypothetical protein
MNSRNEESECTNDLNKLKDLNRNFSTAIDFIRTVNIYLRHDSKGNKIEHYPQYHYSIKNTVTKKKRTLLGSIANEINNNILFERNIIAKRLENYSIEVDNHIHDSITKENDVFKFKYDFNSFLLNDNLCNAVELLTLAYSNNFYAVDGAIEKFNGHILDGTHEYYPLEKIIERIAIKMDLDTSIDIDADSIRGKFKDGSSFDVSPIYKPDYFNCSDYYQLQKWISRLVDDYNEEMSYRESGEHLSFTDYHLGVEYIEESNARFIKRLCDVLNEDVNVNIKIPYKYLSKHKYNDNFSLKKLIEEDIQKGFVICKFKIDRNTLLSNKRINNKQKLILETKLKNTLDGLISCGEEILNSNNVC